MKKTLFYNGIIHTLASREDAKNYMLVENGKITEMGNGEPESFGRVKAVNLNGKHVYPCLIDGHVHLLLTVAVMAMGFNACEITENGVEPHDLHGVEARIRAYAQKQKKNAVIAINNYIMTAIDEARMPTRTELDDWAGGRAVVVYNIDGHSTSLSTKMFQLIGISPDGHNGVLSGEENERAQGRIIDKVSSAMTLSALAKGVSAFQNYCAEYGIGTIGALEGNGDSKKDPTTKLIATLASRFDVGVRLYLQYTDRARTVPYEKNMKSLRVGGCGDWETDGAVGAHSAAFNVPYKDTGKIAPCYFTDEKLNRAVRDFASDGYQIAAHAIGETAINQLIGALSGVDNGRFHRIEHCEFFDDDAFEKLKEGKFAVVVQPGYSWIDKRYLHTYERYLPSEITERMKLKSLIDAGVCVCGSSDSPVQDMDPYLQMLGMTEFYVKSEAITPLEAFKTYTVNAARAIEESNERGTLEVGKVADFFTADENFFTLDDSCVVGFRPSQTYYGGKAYKKKSGSVFSLLKLMLKKRKQI